MRMKKAFTMAEAILVMIILGIIATIMITNLKPTQFRDKGLEVLAKKVLMQIDTATQQIMINNTQSGKLNTIYAPGTTNQFSFSNTTNTAQLQTLYKTYLITTRKPCNDATCPCNGQGNFRFYLKDGSCVAFGQTTTAQNNSIYPGETVETASSAGLGFVFFDINGIDEPNVAGKDRFLIPINQDGTFYD